MRLHLLVYILFCLSASVCAQPNMVLNGNFENYTTCPLSEGQINLCIGWDSYNTGTPDYFNTCANNPVSVPNNKFGYQWAASGSGYLALLGATSTNNSFREYAVSSITPLKAGKYYEVSMSLSLGNLSNLAIDDNGVYFFDNSPTFINSSGILSVAAQVSYSTYGILTDTQNWVRVTSYFQADSAYDNMVIGSFQQPVNINSLSLVSGTGTYHAILYDSIVVRQAGVKITFTDTLVCPADTIRVPYSVDSVLTINSNNVFTLQLSNASGSFANPVNIGTLTSTSYKDTVAGVIPANTPPGTGYLVRLISSNTADTSYYELYAGFRAFTVSAPTNVNNASNSPVCTGDTLRLSGSSTSTGVTWAWTGPNSFTAATQNAVIPNSTMSHAGDYILQATLNSTGCSLRDTTTVVIRPTPDKPTANSNSPVCELNSLQLTTSSSTTGVSYSWTGPNGYSNNTQNPTVTNSAGSTHAGDYISTATLNGCSSRDTTTVVVLPKPAMPTASAPNSPLCARQNLQLNASTVSGASYNWYGPAGFTANTQNPTRNYIQLNEGGKYYVYATISGCISDTDSVTVVVNTDPVVNIFPTPGAVVCPNQQVIFTAIPTNGGTVGYQWFVNGAGTGVSTLTYTTGTLNNNDKVYCLMASTGTCATPFTDTSNEITMTVKQALTPKVTITADAGPSLFPNEPINFTAVHTDAGTAPTFQWKKNGQNVNGANGQIWGANANFLNDGDDICVLITSSYDCPSPDTALSNCIKLDIRLSVDDIANNNNIKVYPNPVKGTLRITSTTTIETITINNLLGQQLMHQTAKGNTADIDMSALAAGVYVVKVNGVYAVRILKE